MENEFVVAVKGLINYDGKILIIQRCEEDEIGAGTWECAGGKVDFGEDLETALMREIGEEVGLTVSVEKLLYAATFKTNEHRQVFLLSYFCTAQNNHVTLSHEHKNYLWADKQQMQNLLPPSIIDDLNRNLVWEHIFPSQTENPDAQKAPPESVCIPPNGTHFMEATEKFDTKIPDVMIVKIPKFRAVTSGLMPFEALFGGDFGLWQEAHNHFFKPIIFDAPDFLYGKDGKTAWLWALKDCVTQADVHPYEIIEHPGGLYAVAVSVDGDGESHNKVRSKTEKWLESTNFVIDTTRELAGHMIYVDHEIKKGLRYHQMNLYVPVKLREGA